MILLAYLFGILLVGYGYLVTVRLVWLYEKAEGHLFWQKNNAKTYYIVAMIWFFIFALALSQVFYIGLLLLFLLGEYALIAAPAVKVSDRGILANIFLVRWPDIVEAQKIPARGEMVLVTKHPWQRIRLQVPAAKESAFRKILAAKGIAIVEDGEEKPQAQNLPAPAVATAEANPAHQPQDGVMIENLA